MFEDGTTADIGDVNMSGRTISWESKVKQKKTLDDFFLFFADYEFPIPR